MKKILISLGVVVVVAAGVVAGTNALFNDTETSTGNIFTAGSIDLKVDHKMSSYNGNDCVKDCVENTGDNLILNGSFEVPEVTNAAKWEIFPNSDPTLKWTVEWVGTQTSYGGYTRPEPALVEYHEGVLGNAKDGNQYAELDSDWFGPNNSLNGEPALVKIHQDITTTPGEKYKLHYYFSPRPNTGGTENIMYVNIDGVTVTTHGPVAGSGSIVWTEYTKEFTATNNTTKVEFVGGGTDNSLGVFLDNVSVHPYDCEYTIVGGTCTLWEEKDLTEGDYFWSFNDVKPGDYGTNLISLHAFSNDAFMCLYTNGIDNENDVIEPELNAGDIVTPPTPNGELSKYLNVFAWADNGDGIYQNTETILAPLNTPLDTEIIQMSLTSSQTSWLGMAWCAGTQSLIGINNDVITCSGAGNQDDAQTDSYVADVVAYAVQQRNNANFSCQDYLNP